MENQMNQQILNDLMEAKYSMDKSVKRASMGETIKKEFTDQSLNRASKSIRKADAMKALPKSKITQLHDRFASYNAFEKCTQLKGGDAHAAREALLSLMKPRQTTPLACPRCGAKITPGKAFCAGCGAQLKTA